MQPRLGITFQQVQKYEKGSNRVSASKLQTMANVLKVPVSFFFEGGPSESNGKRTDSPEFTFADMLSTSEGVALCAAFDKIEDKALRRLLVISAETYAKPMKGLRSPRLCARGALGLTTTAPIERGGAAATPRSGAGRSGSRRCASALASGHG